MMLDGLRAARWAASRSTRAARSLPSKCTLNAGRKVSFSRTLKTADWANTTIAAGDTAEEIDKLRLGGDGHIVVWGGVSLMRLDLIDERASVHAPPFSLRSRGGLVVVAGAVGEPQLRA
ncbi:dihydrofolate reductase family protein [Nonomuraea sp. 3N208]|uniref:dihydrofolate reductase family protein n=1 Tax=Nonomuraea sp. 3N208 TaxID=3457421 RepID=UPI003FCC461D